MTVVMTIAVKVTAVAEAHTRRQYYCNVRMAKKKNKISNIKIQKINNIDDHECIAYEVFVITGTNGLQISVEQITFERMTNVSDDVMSQ